MPPDYIVPRRLPVRVKCGQMEMPQSYLARMCIEAGLDQRWVETAIPGRRRTWVGWKRSRALDLFVEGLGWGDPTGRFDRMRAFAQPIPHVEYQDRFDCIQCSKGAAVHQFSHDRRNLCTKHARWIAPGSTLESQFRLEYDPSLWRAERLHRRHTASGRFNADLTQRVWEMVRDNAFLTAGKSWSPKLDALVSRIGARREVEGRAALYVECVTIAELLTDPQILSRWLNPGLTEAGLRRDIGATLPFQADTWPLANRIVLYLRPSRLRAARHHLTSAWRQPIWGYELDLSAVNTGGWVTPSPPPTLLDVDLSLCLDSKAYGGAVAARPHALLFWNWEANGPRSVWTSYTHNLAIWTCPNGHAWRATGQYLAATSGCPYCSGVRALAGFNDLATLDPRLAAQWDYAPGANSRTPDQVTQYSFYRAAWICSRRHRWTATVVNRSKGTRCPSCPGVGVRTGDNDLATRDPDLASQWDTTPGANDRTPAEVAFKSGYRASWVCPSGHRWKASISNRAVGNDCPTCSGRTVLAGFNDLATLDSQLAAQWDMAPGANDRAPDQVSLHSSYRAKWVCPRGHTWSAMVCDRSAGHRCAVCSGQQPQIGVNDLATLRPELAAEWDTTPGSNNRSPAEVVLHSKYTASWVCDQGHRWTAKVSQRSQGYDCPTCRPGCGADFSQACRSSV
jgi:hypothetical protein